MRGAKLMTKLMRSAVVSIQNRRSNRTEYVYAARLCSRNTDGANARQALPRKSTCLHTSIKHVTYVVVCRTDHRIQFRLVFIDHRAQTVTGVAIGRRVGKDDRGLVGNQRQADREIALVDRVNQIDCRSDRGKRAV